MKKISFAFLITLLVISVFGVSCSLDSDSDAIVVPETNKKTSTVTIDEKNLVEILQAVDKYITDTAWDILKANGITTPTALDNIEFDNGTVLTSCTIWYKTDTDGEYVGFSANGDYKDKLAKSVFTSTSDIFAKFKFKTSGSDGVFKEVETVVVDASTKTDIKNKVNNYYTSRTNLYDDICGFLRGFGDEMWYDISSTDVTLKGNFVSNNKTVNVELSCREGVTGTDLNGITPSDFHVLAIDIPDIAKFTLYSAMKCEDGQYHISTSTSWGQYLYYKSEEEKTVTDFWTVSGANFTDVGDLAKLIDDVFNVELEIGPSAENKIISHLGFLSLIENFVDITGITANNLTLDGSITMYKNSEKVMELADVHLKNDGVVKLYKSAPFKAVTKGGKIFNKPDYDGIDMLDMNTTLTLSCNVINATGDTLASINNFRMPVNKTGASLRYCETMINNGETFTVFANYFDAKAENVTGEIVFPKGNNYKYDFVDIYDMAVMGLFSLGDYDKSQFKTKR